MRRFHPPTKSRPAYLRLRVRAHVHVHSRRLGMQNHLPPTFSFNTRDLAIAERRAQAGSLRAKLFLLLEIPESSCHAKLLNRIFLAIVLLGILFVTMETIPSMRAEQPWQLWLFLDLSINGPFLLELALRFAVAPSCCRYLADPLNLMDVAASAPFVADLVLTPLLRGHPAYGSGEDALLGHRWKLLRVLRIFRTSRVRAWVALEWSFLIHSSLDAFAALLRIPHLVRRLKIVCIRPIHSRALRKQLRLAFAYLMSPTPHPPH